MGNLSPIGAAFFFERLIIERLIMSIEEKNFSRFCHEEMRKEPDYMLSTLANMWKDEIISDRRRKGSPPGTIEDEEIYSECLSIILAGIESGKLEATYPEKNLFESSKYVPETREIIKESIKMAPFWIIETSKYIDWARANGAGPKQLVEDFIEGKAVTVINNNTKQAEKPIDPRERNSLLKIIAALCEKSGVRPDQSGLGKELEEITQRLGIEVQARAISEHLKKATELVK